MREKLRFQPFKYYAMLFFFALVLCLCVIVGQKIYHLHQLNKDQEDGIIFVALAIFFLGFLVVFLKWLGRKTALTEVFTVSEKGLENVYTIFLFMILLVMPTAKLIPWECIQQFHITTWVGKRQYIVADIDAAKIPSDIPFLMKLFLKNPNGRLNGFYFGSRSVDMPAEELLTVLNEYHSKYHISA